MCGGTITAFHLYDVIFHVFWKALAMESQIVLSWKIASGGKWHLTGPTMRVEDISCQCLMSLLSAGIRVWLFGLQQSHLGLD